MDATPDIMNMSPAEVKKWAAEMQKKAGVEPNSKPAKKKQGRLPNTKDPVKKLAEPVAEPLEAVLEVIHFYTRQGETTGQNDYRARQERKDRGPSVIIVTHSHDLTNECEDTCKEIK